MEGPASDLVVEPVMEMDAGKYYCSAGPGGEGQHIFKVEVGQCIPLRELVELGNILCSSGRKCTKACPPKKNQHFFSA